MSTELVLISFVPIDMVESLLYSSFFSATPFTDFVARRSLILLLLLIQHHSSRRDTSNSARSIHRHHHPPPPPSPPSINPRTSLRKSKRSINQSSRLRTTLRFQSSYISSPSIEEPSIKELGAKTIMITRVQKLWGIIFPVCVCGSSVLEQTKYRSWETG